MKDNLLSHEELQILKERYLLAMERIEGMEQENTVGGIFADYFHRISAFVRVIRNLVTMVEEERIRTLSFKELKALNRTLYEDILGDNYEVSYANPTYACMRMGNKFGKLLSFLYTELRSLIIFAYEGRLPELTIYLELLIEVYNYFEEENKYTFKDVKRAIYDFMSDYCDILVGARTREMIDTELSFAKDIIMGADLTNPQYLFYFGDYISKNELETAEFLNTLSQEEIQSMADTYTEGFRLGFLANRLDLSKKSIVHIRYQLGFERMVRAAVLNFRKLGLEPVFYRAAYQAVNKRQHIKIGYHGTSPNKQYDYDHRFDLGLFLDKAFQERRLSCLKYSLEQWKEKTVLLAGPTLIEVFGETLFDPEDKKEAIKLDKRQQKLYVDYYTEDSLLRKEYMKLEETSFTIISYPVPEIGEDFKAIFSETVKINTLKSEVYSKIQQKIIDALDQGDTVRVLGAGQNHTDMTVKLYPLKDPRKETIFENCVADVNIPVGEVFTSPVLKGTNGILHVPRVYLNDLEYRELELTFTDGKVTDYTCKNFADEARNRNYIKENLLFSHEMLPLGEFAIGTNTTAYMMGKRYDIAARLPILIAEKTGPHFAIGDTCYKMSEEVKVYNPDGKEIVARENEISALRNSAPDLAYFNCHTDITLPYDEIREIAVVTREGKTIPIIENTRFVLEGTQSLNEAFG